MTAVAVIVIGLGRLGGQAPNSEVASSFMLTSNNANSNELCMLNFAIATTKIVEAAAHTPLRNSA